MDQTKIETATAVQVPLPDVEQALLKARLLGGVANNFANMNDVFVTRANRSDMPPESLSEDGNVLMVAYSCYCGPFSKPMTHQKLDNDHYFYREEISGIVFVVKLVDAH